MKQYHDNEWCVPSHDDTYLFELLNLEGAQAGLSWNTVLSKRQDYQNAFHHFDIAYCAGLTDADLDGIKERYNVIKNGLKLKAVRSNALAVIKIQQEFGSFSNFLWNYVGGKPVVNSWATEDQIPARTPLSEQISRDLKKRGFLFAGPVIIYSFLQAIGMVDDHMRSCPYHTLNRRQDS
jgi:3-methyladenine DNA glycosylase